MNLEMFTIFSNKYKKSENQPDYKISALLDGEWKEVGACWKKENEGGAYLSCKVTGVYDGKTNGDAKGSKVIAF